MAARHDKVQKALALILSLSGTRSGMTLRELMAEHDLGLRTLQRMLRAIEQVCGALDEVPSDTREKRWRLRATPLARSGLPSAAEVAELELAAVRLMQDGLPDRAELVRLAASRIRAAASDAQLRRLEPDIEAMLISEGIAARPAPSVVLPESILQRLRHAILSGHRIRLHYRRADNKARWHVLEPYGLLYGARPYLLALRPGKPDVAVWRLDRILNLEEIREPFVPREAFDIRSLTADCFGIWREPPFDVELRFSPEAAGDARAWRFHGSQTQEMLEDGSLLIHFRAGGLEEMAAHLAAWGSAVEIVKPITLRQRLADLGRTLLERHGDRGKPFNGALHVRS